MPQTFVSYYIYLMFKNYSISGEKHETGEGTMKYGMLQCSAELEVTRYLRSF